MLAIAELVSFVGGVLIVITAFGLGWGLHDHLICEWLRRKRDREQRQSKSTLNSWEITD